MKILALVILVAFACGGGLTWYSYHVERQVAAHRAELATEIDQYQIEVSHKLAHDLVKSRFAISLGADRWYYVSKIEHLDAGASGYYGSYSLISMDLVWDLHARSMYIGDENLERVSDVASLLYGLKEKASELKKEKKTELEIGKERDKFRDAQGIIETYLKMISFQ